MQHCRLHRRSTKSRVVSGILVQGRLGCFFAPSAAFFFAIGYLRKSMPSLPPPTSSVPSRAALVTCELTCRLYRARYRAEQING